jgi:hypothetical protein
VPWKQCRSEGARVPKAVVAAEQAALRHEGARSGAGAAREGPWPDQPEWTRLRPIRTVVEVGLEFAVFTREPFGCQRIAGEVGRLRRLGMSLRAIGAALGVHEKAVRNALSRPPQADALRKGERPS